MRRSRWLSLAMVLVLLASTGALVGAGPPPSRPTPGEAAFAPGRILVKFRPGTTAAQKADAHRAQGARALEVIPGVDVQVVSVPRGAERARVAAYARSPLVAYAEPDYIAYASEGPVYPDDTYFDKQWGLHNDGTQGTEDADIDAPEAWDETTGSADILIAILDSGIDQNHPDLEGKLEDNVDFTGSDSVDDFYGHGTHVAGIAAAETNNGQGVAGVGYNSSLLNVKVLGDEGWGYYSWIADGIVWAADPAKGNAQVINMSLGGKRKSTTLEDAVNYAWSKGVVVVAAAGNDGNPSANYPAYYENCIAVAATDSNDQKPRFSQYGDWVDVAAPGLYVYSTIPNHTSYLWGTPDGTPYDYGSGTSMATPHVAGLAALVWAEYPGFANADVRAEIEATCDAIDGTGTYWVYGRINACEAVGGTCDGPADNPPSVSIISPAEGAVVVETVTIQIDATDAEDPAGSLNVEWNVDGGEWQPTTYNSGYYEATWETTTAIEGSHTINARAADSGENAGSDSNSVIVDNVNDLPVATFTFACAGLTCNFYATESYDPDGTIVTYAWDFGDTEAGSGETTSHTYAAVDTYSVVLTVIDDDGATDTDSQEVTVIEAGATMHVGDLDGTKDLKGKSGRWEVFVTVTIHDENHNPVADSTVTGEWSAATTGTVSGSTGSDGTVTLSTGNMSSGTDVTFTVTDVTHDTLTYDDAANHDPDGDSDIDDTSITIDKN